MKESVGKITIAVENRGKNAIAPIYIISKTSGVNFRSPIQSEVNLKLRSC